MPTPDRGADPAAPPAPAGQAPRRHAEPIAWPTTSRPRRHGLADHVGAFAVTAGIGAQDRVAGVQGRAWTTTTRSCIESLADRLAEAFAERLHQRVRTEFWGTSPRTSSWTTSDADRREVPSASARPPAIPACPDHTEKRTLWDLLDVTRDDRHRAHRVAWRCGPAPRSRAGTSATPQSQYFVVGRLGPRPGGGRTPSARAGRSPRPRGGSRRTWATTPMTEPSAAAEGRRFVTNGTESAPGSAVGDQPAPPADLPAAVLWDMDGTLVDTEPYWINTEHALAERVRRHLERRHTR